MITKDRKEQIKLEEKIVKILDENTQYRIETIMNDYMDADESYMGVLIRESAKFYKIKGRYVEIIYSSKLGIDKVIQLFALGTEILTKHFFCEFMEMVSVEPDDDSTVVFAKYFIADKKNEMK